MLRTSVLGGEEAFSNLSDAWRELVQDSVTATPFQTFDWHDAFRRHYGTSRRVKVLAVYEGRDLIALTPFVRSFGACRSIRPHGIGPSDYLHPLVHTEREEVATAATRNAFLEMRGIDLIDWRQVRETRTWSQTGERRLVEARCIVVDLPPTYAAFVGAQSKSLRYDLRRADKAPFATGEAKLEDAGPDGFARLVEQHKSRWRKRGMPGAFVGRAYRFHQEWVRRCHDAGMLRLSHLVYEGQSIASIYAMTLGKTCYYYQAGVSVEPKSISPGTLLIGATVRRAIDEGVTHFDMMRGDEPYKLRWQSHQVYANLRLITPLTPVGRLGARQKTWESAVEGRIRARLEGRGLF